MKLRTLLVASLLASSALLLLPSTAAQAALPCPSSTSPGVLSSGVAVAGSDPTPGTLTSPNTAADCYYVISIDGDPTGKQLRIVTSHTSNHDIGVKETLASASPYACSSSASTATADTCTAWWPLVAPSYSIRVGRMSSTASNFTITAFVEAAPASGCSNGFAVTPLVLGAAPVSGSLLDAANSRCTYVISGPSDFAAPADDVVRSALQPLTGNFDINVRRGLPPTAAGVRDCVSALTGAVLDACETVQDPGLPLYVMVRRTLGGGSYNLSAAVTGSSCGLGSGYHPLENGVDASSHTRTLPGSKCYFSAGTDAAQDLLTITQRTTPQANSILNIPAHALTVAKDAPIGVGAVECSGTSLHLIFSGFDLSAPAVCDKLLEDGLDHEWSIRVARASGSGGTGDPRVLFSIGYVAQTIPTLLNGVPQVGHVGVGETQYWKVAVPEGATTLLVQTVGDPGQAACSLGSQAHSAVALACLLLPFPSLIACGLAAGYGVDCSALTGSFYDTCIGQLGNESADACAQIDQARIDACGAIDEISPGACDGADVSGLSVKFTEMDLVVRHRLGLPTTAVNDCRSATPGPIEQCLFSDLIKEVHDEILVPVLGHVDGVRGDLAQSIAENRTPIDQAFANLTAAIADGRAEVIDPAWADLREALFNATGQDPGALPGVPSVVPTSLPPFPALGLPDPLKANPFPGAGKYFIAVRGPSSGLLNKGGDYAIVAVHDAPKVPSMADVDTQIDQLQQALADVEIGLPVLPDALDPVMPVVHEVEGPVNEAIDGVQEALPDDLGLPQDLPVPIILPDQSWPFGSGLVGQLIDQVEAVIDALDDL